ncbi:MAG: LysR substrate-binding domain-containing protein [Mycetocola sp.]
MPEQQPSPTTPAPSNRAEPLRLGHTLGTSPGKWLRVWSERFPRRPIELVALAEAATVGVLADLSLDAALIRHDADAARVPLINQVPLYQEALVAAVDREHSAAQEDTISLTDLTTDSIAVTEGAGISITSLVPATADHSSPTTADLLALVATGAFVGVTTQPLARAVSRKDIAALLLSDGMGPHISLIWPQGDDEVVQELLGVMRGRKANSSRGSLNEPAEQEKKSPRPAPKRSQTPAKRQQRAPKRGSGRRR